MVPRPQVMQIERKRSRRPSSNSDRKSLDLLNRLLLKPASAQLLASVDKGLLELGEPFSGGSNSVVECQLPKLDVAGSIPVSRSKFFLSKIPSHSLRVQETTLLVASQQFT